MQRDGSHIVLTRERPHLQGVPSSAYSILCKSKICETAYLQKQSAGLFLNSPLAERLNVLQGSALHLPEALPLDSGKGEPPLQLFPRAFFFRTDNLLSLTKVISAAIKNA